MMNSGGQTLYVVVSRVNLPHLPVGPVHVVNGSASMDQVHVRDPRCRRNLSLSGNSSAPGHSTSHTTTCASLANNTIQPQPTPSTTPPSRRQAGVRSHRHRDANTFAGRSRLRATHCASQYQARANIASARRITTQWQHASSSRRSKKNSRR